MLLALGTAGDHDTGAVLVENIGDLVAEVADDLYLRKWGAAGSAPADMTREAFHQLAQAAATDPATALLPVHRRPTACPASARGSPPRCAPRSTGASGGSSSSTTTTC